MTTGATGQLGLALPVQGELSGTWGDTVNNGITQYTNIAIAGTLTLTGDGAVTLANTTGDASASNITSTLAGAGTVTAQFAIVKVSGTTTTKVVTGPSYSKTYVVDNASSFAVTFKASGQTGVSIAAAEKVTVVFNGTDYIKLAGTIANAAGSNTQIQFNNGGLFGASANLTWDGTTLSSTQVNITGQGTLRLQDTTGGEYVGLRSPSALGASYTLTFPADDGTSGQALITDGSGVLSWSTAASGDVYGPASATDNALARFDGTTGKLIQDSVVIVGDTGAVTGVTDLTASGSVTLSGGTANGVAYLNGSKVVTSGSALTFNGSTFGVNFSSASNYKFYVSRGGTAGELVAFTDGTAQTLTIDTAASSILLNSANGGALAFGVTTEQMRLTSTGLGIGTSSPQAKLVVSNAGAAGYEINPTGGIGGGATVSTYNRSTSAYTSLTTYSSAMTWYNGSTRAMDLDASGNFLVGTSTALASATGRGNITINGSTDALLAFGNATALGGYILRNTSGITYFSDGDTYQRFFINSAEQMRLTSTGLGIGTSSPSYKLDITASTSQNGLRVRNTLSNIPTIVLGATDTANVDWTIQNNAGNLVFNGGSTGGNVGIGTSSPTDKLTLNSSGSGTGFKITGYQPENFINLNNTLSTGNRTFRLLSGITSVGYDGFSVFDTVANATRLVINNSGNLGIGTSSPSYKLDVNGDARINNFLWFTPSSGGMALGANGTNFEIYNGAGTETRLTLNNSGNLGLGVTPSGWSLSGLAAMQVKNGGLYGYDLTEVGVTSNAYYGSSAWRYVSGAQASRFVQVSGQHQWFTAPSGTAGNAISFTQAMTLDASGQLGVGTTAPVARLHVGNGAGLQQAYVYGGGYDLALGASGGAFLGFASQAISAIFNTASVPIGIGTNASQPLIFGTSNTERARIDSSGNLLIGTTSASAKLNVVGTASASGWTTAFGNGTAYQGVAGFGNAAIGVGTWNWQSTSIPGSGTAQFYTRFASVTSGGTAVHNVAIDGDLLVGDTGNAIGSKIYVNAGSAGEGVGILVNSSNSYRPLALWNSASSGNRMVIFYTGSGPAAAGSIESSGTTTTYNTSSDYRLKNITGPITNSGAYIDSLNPVEGTWKADGSAFVGLIAHEVQEASRTFVATGVKDSEEMQGMDYSSPEIIANMIAEIQSLRKRLADAGI